MSDYEKHDWIVTTIEVRYIDGSTRLIRLSPGENYRDAAGENWISVRIIRSPYGGAYSHDDIPIPEPSPEGEKIDEAGTREGAAVPG
jgi:hypothetical protein